MGVRVSLAVSVCILTVALAGCDSGVVTVASDRYEDMAELSGDQMLELVLQNRRPADNAPWDWYVAESGVVELVSSESEMQEENQGVSGSWTLTFAPVEAGTADLMLVYRLPDQPDVEPTLPGAVSDYPVTVTVTDPPAG